MPEKNLPGAPTTEPVSYDEPTTPVDPPAPKPDQAGPANVSPTGADYGADPTTNAQQGQRLTSAVGIPLRNTDHSLTAGPRGPILLQDQHFREKISHFDHERIPERVVHARGAAAHGVFEANGAAEKITRAAFLKKGVKTDTFVRFSTVLGSRGSMDTARDTRGFATKFYTTEGNYDLVGNNIPVFFIQDAIKFPDVIHAGKPHPDREIPQAQSAHDTFWDFVSLHTEAQHHTIWNMSDRGIPRSYRTMEGFGVHTWRLVNDAGETTLVKFHWKPRLGVHSTTWEEAQIAGGTDPDFHRRDLAVAIEAGAHPQWDFGVQVFPDTEDQMFEGIDLLDPTKIVPEELAPVQIIGTMTLNRNPINFFAETEQVMFNPANLVPGIDVTYDPLLQGRLFSYQDTQLTRLGGPNFQQIPINRPHVPVNDMLRDGFHQHAVHGGVAPYHPNSLDANNPLPTPPEEGSYIEVPQRFEAVTDRKKAATFDDHYSQVGLFFRSLTPVEQEHVVNAYTFELSKCWDETIRKRQLQALANVDATLCSRVATGLGLEAPSPTGPAAGTASSAALSQLGKEWPVDGRQVGIIVDAASDLAAVGDLRSAFLAAGVVPLVVAPTGGPLGDGVVANRTWANASSVEFDALVLTTTAAPAPDALVARDAKAGQDTEPGVDPRVDKLLGEAWRHAKAIAAVPDAQASLLAAGVVDGAPGVTVGGAAELGPAVLAALAKHRAWERFPTAV
ncbi:catalase [Tersicoccus solisilvae]|uniref:Catalase n=1 Tax=Tersicoccus solisilvae TaxID=1882339 RepID=A0ABQ1NIV0_9MICC|nr:catalase [Tersicoccus solisilvae]GGC78324.1 catalase [Tersicoccus solisilvae]